MLINSLGKKINVKLSLSWRINLKLETVQKNLNWKVFSVGLKNSNAILVLTWLFLQVLKVKDVN